MHQTIQLMHVKLFGRLSAKVIELDKATGPTAVAAAQCEVMLWLILN